MVIMFDKILYDSSLNFIVANVPALEDLWIIGDHFLADIFPTLQSLSSNDRFPIYLYQYFNVSAYYQNPASMTRNTMSKIMNATTKALNERVRLPDRYVLVIMDIDILSSINFYEICHAEDISEMCFLPYQKHQPLL